MKSCIRDSTAWILASTWTACLAASPAAAAVPVLARKAQTILTLHCTSCHGPNSPGKGGLNYILDRDRLVARHKIVPGHAADSKLYQRVHNGEMPPKGVTTRPSPQDIALLQQWIDAGAPAAESLSAHRPFISEAEISRRILADLRTVPPRQRRFLRYFTFTNLHNAGVSDRQLPTAHHALSKLINSLSWHPRITVPRPIDAAASIVRIDLRDLQWTAGLWNQVLAVYPYRLPQAGAAFQTIARATGCELPYVRADWFVATAAQPPLYYDLLQLPGTDRELERQLRVDVVQDIQDDDVIRAGFNGSGVSRNNRLLERHDAAFGAYWRSYDFSENTDRQNLFEHPLGPLSGDNSFEHAGGEIIFHLPNGLQGYMLVDGNGRRLERASIEIVSDPRRPDRVVTTGVSCMSCHVQGVIFKADQIRAHVAKNPQAFSRDDIETVRALYVPEAGFKKLIDLDRERFQKAVQKTASPLTEPECISALTRSYEGEVTLAEAAAEVGLQPADFLQRLGRSSSLSRTLGALKVPGGTVQRTALLAAFPNLIQEFHLTDEGKTAAAVPDLLAPAQDFRPFAGHTGHILCMAFSPDGRQALSGGEDNTVRLWEVKSGREIRPLEGHTDEVLAVAFSPDGKRALSGGMDRTIRLWDLASGRTIRRLEGHTDRISSLAFSPDGKRALSGSWDQMVSLWDLDTGKEIRRMGGHSSYVSSVAFSPDGRQALSGGYDQTVRLWDLAGGRELRRFLGSGREVYSVAFAPDGHYALAGGNDGIVRLWNMQTGKEVRQFKGAGRAIIGVAFTPDGGVLAGSSQYQGSAPPLHLWDLKTGHETHHWGGGRDTVWSVAFSFDGRWALTGTSAKTLRLWDLRNALHRKR